MLLPKIIIAGVAKCGTTALWYNLDKHPDIHMIKPSNEGHKIEIHFWSKNVTNERLSWYFNRCKEGKINGDKSTEYASKRDTMELIKQYIPDAKIILCVRNPVDRAYSEYQMHKRSGREHKFDPNLRFGKGNYIKLIRDNIAQIFNEDNICISVAECMKKNPTYEMAKIFNFLGVKDLALPGKIVDGNLLKNITRSEDIVLNKNEPFYRVWNFGTKLTDEIIRRELSKRYEKINKKLFDYLGYSIKEWEI
jgi:hypothetical protein